MSPSTGDGSHDAAGSGQDARVARTKADVSRAALRVLTDEGGCAVTHSHVAEVAGYSKTTLYTHWPNRSDLIRIALEAIGEMPHSTRSGDLRTDVLGELAVFRQALSEQRLDQVIAAAAQWATVDEMRRMRDALNTEGQRLLRAMLSERLTGDRLEAAVQMLTGLVACPALMYGAQPDDAVLRAGVDFVLGTS